MTADCQVSLSPYPPHQSPLEGPDETPAKTSSRTGTFINSLCYRYSHRPRHIRPGPKQAARPYVDLYLGCCRGDGWLVVPYQALSSNSISDVSARH